jgi:hypothetical protein
LVLGGGRHVTLAADGHFGLQMTNTTHASTSTPLPTHPTRPSHPDDGRLDLPLAQQGRHDLARLEVVLVGEGDDGRGAAWEDGVKYLFHLVVCLVWISCV